MELRIQSLNGEFSYAKLKNIIPVICKIVMYEVLPLCVSNIRMDYFNRIYCMYLFRIK